MTSRDFLKFSLGLCVAAIAPYAFYDRPRSVRLVTQVPVRTAATPRRWSTHPRLSEIRRRRFYLVDAAQKRARDSMMKQMDDFAFKALEEAHLQSPMFYWAGLDWEYRD